MATIPFELRQRLENAEFRLEERQQQLVQAERDLANSRANPNLQDLIVSQLNNLERARGRLEQAENEVNQVRTEIQAFVDQGPGTESAGQTTQQAQAANDDGADTQSPQPEQQVLAPDGRIRSESPTTVPSNAAGTDTVPDAGTDAAVRKADQLQSVPATGAQTPIQPGSPSNRVIGGASAQNPSAPTPAPGAQRGAAADGDDNTNPTVARINRIFGGPQATIRPEPNVLDQYASYTYNISIYLTNSQTYQQIRQNPAAGLLGANLLMQSGGAPLSSGVVSQNVGGDTGEIPGVTTQSLLTQGRNQEFPLDFYIDNLEIVSFAQGKGTGGAHNAVELSFQVLEPTGITFLDRLAAAVRRYVRGNDSNGQANNYAAQAYLMVIRFWGYDADGNLVRAANAVTTPGAAQEPGLIVEKYIPFRFTQIKFRLANRIAQYDCRAVCLRDYVAPSQSRGIIPYNIELTAVSLQDLLGVNLGFGTANQARDTQGRNGTSAQGTGTTSATQADVRRIDNAINSRSADPTRSLPAGSFAAEGFVDPTQDQSGISTPAAAPSQSSAPPKATAAPSPVLVRGLTAALNEFQAQLVRNGTYEMADVYEIIVNEPVLKEAMLQPAEAATGLRSVPMSSGQTAGAKKLGIKQQVNRDNKNVAAVAGMSIVQFLDQIVRNSSYIMDQQTKIYKKDSTGKWITQPRATGAQNFAWYRIGMDAVPISDRIDQKRNDRVYRITYTITPYLVNENQSGWFPASKFSGTHKKYQYWFTGLNTQIISYEQDYDYLYYITINNGSLPVAQIGDYREYTQRVFQARAPEASQGAAGPVFDPPALAAGSLYSPADTARIKMTIMGDPAWIQQGEISTGIKELEENIYGPFLPDGTINYDSREPLFEVTFNTAGDYNLDTGLMDVTRRPS